MFVFSCGKCWMYNCYEYRNNSMGVAVAIPIYHGRTLLLLLNSFFIAFCFYQLNSNEVILLTGVL